MMTTAALPTANVSPRDGAQAASAEFAEKVREAEAAIRAYTAERPGEQWTLRHLREATADGRSSSVMTTALYNMDHRGELIVDYVASAVSAAD
jgi:hypothetical protein